MITTNKLNKNYEELIKENIILNCDSECLFDYFSFQFKRYIFPLNIDLKKYPQIKVFEDKYIFECFNNQDCIEFSKFFYQNIKNNKTVLYFYNADFDRELINALLNLVYNNNNNILFNLRRISNYLIGHNGKKITPKYFRQVAWDNKKKEDFIKNNPHYEILNTLDIKRNLILKSNSQFVLTVVDIAETLNIKTSESEKTSLQDKISLKDMQLFEEGYNIKFNFDKYDTIQAIKNNKLYETFIKYALNDIEYQERIYINHGEEILLTRIYAIEAVNKNDNINIPFIFKNIFTTFAVNTSIIEQILLPKKQNKITNIDYTKYINTNYDKFNKFIKFANENKEIKEDNILMASFINTQLPEHEQINLNNKNLSVLLKNSYKDYYTIDINGTSTQFSLGGGHGAIENYKGYNLSSLDYRSQYPSTILQYKEYFEGTLLVDRYEYIYNTRIKYKKLAKDKTLPEEERIKYKNLEKGLKLILNSSYGLINKIIVEGGHNLNNKNLARFITLKCQSLLYNLCDRTKVKPININTDGVIFETNNLIELNKIIKEDFISNGKGYYVLDKEMYSILIQNNVNNYFTDNKSKGQYFNVKTKQHFIQNNKPNIFYLFGKQLILNEEIEITPIYFKRNKSNINNSHRYYFTSEKYGKNPVFTTSKRDTLHIGNEKLYVTNDINKADINIYKKVAEYYKNRILTYQWGMLEVLSEYPLTCDNEKNNKYKKEELKRLKKLLNTKLVNIGYSGFLGDIKKDSYINSKLPYNKKAILESTYTQGFTLHSTYEFVIIDIDLRDKKTNKIKSNIPNEFIELINKVKTIDTFKVWNEISKNIGNIKLIFKNDTNKVYEPIKTEKNIIEIVSKAVIWSTENVDNKYTDNNKKPLNISDYIDILEGLIIETETNAEKKYNEKLETSNIEFKNTLDTSKDLIDITINKLLKTYNITCIENAKNSNGGYNYKICCPYCINKTDYYKNNDSSTYDTFLNVNKNKNEYSINFHTWSNTCKNDKEHKLYFEDIKKYFNKIKPDITDIKSLELIEELKNIINKAISYNTTNIYNEDFFIKDTIVIAGVGTGKSYNSCNRALINITKNTSTIISTLENSNIESLESAIIKNIKNFITDIKKHEENFTISENLKDILKPISEKQESSNTLKMLKIFRLTNINNSEDYKKANIILTNHKYFYNIGHLANNNKNMLEIKKEFELSNKPLELILDEFEAFGTMGIINIPLNEYRCKTLDHDSNKWYTFSKSNVLYNKRKELMKQEDLYILAEKNIKQSINPNDKGICEYSFNHKEGLQELERYIKEYTKTIKNVKYDCGNRRPKEIIKNCGWSYLVVDKMQQLELDFNTGKLESENNFLRLLQMSRYYNITTKTIRIGKTLTVEEKNINYSTNFGTELKTPTDLIEFAMKNLSKEEYSKLKEILLAETEKELYTSILSLGINSILETFKCNKYYLTGNIIKHYKYPVNTKMAFNTRKPLEYLKIVIIEKEKACDKMLFNNLNVFENSKLEFLIFSSYQKNTEKYFEKLPNFAEYQTSKGSMINSNNEESNNTYKHIRIANANGKESQGKNYCHKDTLILTTTIPINMIGRIHENDNGICEIMSLENKRREKIIQMIGRILRGDIVAKNILLIGDLKTIETSLDYFKNYDYKIEITNYTKSIKRNTDHEKAFKTILEYFEGINNKYNLGNENIDIININEDNRKNNNKKYDKNEIWKYYLSEVKRIKKETKKKPKDIIIIPDIINKFGISERQFKNIKKELK